MSTVTVDFVASGRKPNTIDLVIVVQGPWSSGEVDERLRELQEKLYGCMEAALYGEVATRFPESTGQTVAIRVEGFNLPEQRVHSFFSTFSSSVLELPDYAAALAHSPFVSDIEFELTLQRLPS